MIEASIKRLCGVLLLTTSIAGAVISLGGCDTGRGESVPITPKKLQPDSDRPADTEGRSTESEEERKERERREREEQERREREDQERREREKQPYQQGGG